MKLSGEIVEGHLVSLLHLFYFQYRCGLQAPVRKVPTALFCGITREGIVKVCSATLAGLATESA